MQNYLRFLACAATIALAYAADSAKPNILFIPVDDLRPELLGW